MLSTRGGDELAHQIPVPSERREDAMGFPFGHPPTIIGRKQVATHV